MTNAQWKSVFRTIRWNNKANEELEDMKDYYFGKNVGIGNMLDLLIKVGSSDKDLALYDAAWKMIG